MFKKQISERAKRRIIIESGREVRRVHMGFIKKEREQLKDSYFKKIHIEETYYELESECTKHRWIIKKIYGERRVEINIYHKHTADTPYYHFHDFATNVSLAIKKIKEHDNYVMNIHYEGRLNTFIMSK
jgi:hypothetical protein